MMRDCSEAMPVAGSMGGNLKQPMKLVDKKPNYPEQLAAAKVGGKIVFDARINPDGMVGDLQATLSENPDLEQAAATAIRQWEFSPTLLNCVAVDVPMKITVNFRAE